jgi:SAM-dependent methyltransferase
MPSDPKALSFGAAAGAYDRARPEYPAEAIAWLLPESPKRVADAGAGTGKLTGVLQAAGHDLVAIEPDPQMLQKLAERFPGIPALQGSAESLPLDDASVDALTYGQAWHWVDPVPASREAARVLRPDGVLGLIWNLRDESVDWVAELGGIMHQSAAERMIAEGGVVVTEPFGEPERATFTWANEFDVQGLVDLAASRSYVITAEPERRERILEGVRALGERVADEHGRIAMPYRTEVYRFRLV